jgi:hypothetical protein
MVTSKDMKDGLARRMNIIEEYIFNLDAEPEHSKDEFEQIKDKLIKEFKMVWEDMPKGIEKE